MKKTIWFINEYNQIPGTQWRKSRSATICELLSQKYNVIWWTASFDHQTKKQRPLGEITISDNYRIRIVKTSGYKKHVSFKRVLRDNSFAKSLKKAILKEPLPDLIITNGNPIRFCEPEYKYVKKYSIPIVVMMDDIWPEVIEMAIPKLLKPFVHLSLIPMYRKRKKFFRFASGLISTGTHHLKDLIAVPKDKKERKAECVYNGIDVNYFRGLLKNKPSNSLCLPPKQANEIWCVFSGELGANYDIELITNAAEYFYNKGTNIRFFMTGTGPLKEYATKKSNELSNFTYLGLIPYEDLVALYSMCDIGLAPYKTSESIDMPDKLFDYFAAGLAVVCSLNKDAGDFLRNYKAGEVFRPKNLESFTSKIESLCKEDVLRKTKENAYSLGASFDVKEQMGKFKKVVDDILEQ